MSKKATGPVDLNHEAANNTGIHKDLRALMRIAAQYEWTGRRTGKGGIQITSPDGQASAYLPLRSGDPGRLEQTVRRQIENWLQEQADKEAKEEFGVTASDFEVTEGTAPTARCKEHDIEFASWEALSAHVAREHYPDEQEDDALEKATVEAGQVSETLAEAASQSGTMATSDEEFVAPFLSIGGRREGRVLYYESDAVLEVRKGDQVVYRCSFCDYQSARPNGVSSHYKIHVRDGEVEPSKSRQVILEEDGVERVYAKSARARSDLAGELYTAMRSRSRHGKGTEPLMKWCNALADIILKNREERGVEQVREAEEAEVITVSSQQEGDLVQQIKDLVAPDLMEELAQAKAAREEAEAKATRLQENIRALTSLVTEDLE